MRCLVTGAAGFLGSHVVSQLLQSGSEVTVLLRQASDLRRIHDLLPQTQIIVGDLLRVADVKNQIIDSRPEVIFHLAWTGGSSGRHQNDPAQFETNLPGSLNLLQIASDAGVRRWIGIGTAFEYGNLPDTLTELLLPKPNTLYAISKYSLCLATAKMCALHGIEYIWARPFAIYGTEDDPRGLIPFVAKSLLRGQRPALTAGAQCWDYTYVEDAARALVQLAITPNAQGIYNLASGTAQTVRTLVERIRDMINPDLPLGFGEIPYHPDQIMNLKADITKLQQLTGWSAQVPLDDGLRSVIEESRRQAYGGYPQLTDTKK